jgi:hypothetical protein
MRPSPHKLRVPPGTLRRFRLPPGVALRDRVEPRSRKRAWALLPFGVFALLTYWLSAGRPVPNVSQWLAGLPRADRAGAAGSSDNAPRLEPASAIAASQAATEEPPTSAPAPPQAHRAAPSKPSKRKPPLVLEHHRLRPVLGWEDPSQ